MEERQWQRPNDDTDNRTLNEMGDNGRVRMSRRGTKYILMQVKRDQEDPWKIWNNISKHKSLKNSKCVGIDICVLLYLLDVN